MELQEYNRKMTNHPNRSRNKTPAANPTPDQIRTARINAGLTQKEAAVLIYATERAWSSWESESGSKRRMPPGLFELFLIKTGQHDEYVTSFVT